MWRAVRRQAADGPRRGSSCTGGARPVGRQPRAPAALRRDARSGTGARLCSASPASQLRCQAAKSAYCTGSSGSVVTAGPRQTLCKEPSPPAPSTPTPTVRRSTMWWRVRNSTCSVSPSRKRPTRMSGPRARSNGRRASSFNQARRHQLRGPAGERRQVHERNHHTGELRQDHLSRLTGIALQHRETPSAAPRAAAPPP